MSIFSNIFNPQPKQETPVPTPQDTNPANPNPSPQPNSQTPAEPQNPLDAYAKLFDNANKSQQADGPPSFNLDPETLTKVSGSLDFTQGIDPDLLSKATSGDSQAFLKIINQVGQRSYQAALHHGTTLTDKYVGARSEYDRKALPSHVRQSLTDHALNSIPNATHPVIKQQLKMISSQMQAANPDASPGEIAQAASKYIQDLAGALNPSQSASKASDSAEDMDWAAYMQS